MKKREKLIYALGDLFGGGAQSLVSVVYLFFLNTFVGLNIVVAGTVVLISRFWDAISDPLMGVISDNTRTKIGRRRPYILVGGFLIALIFALMWLPIGGWESDLGKFIYVLATYILYSTVSTVIAVPYNSYSAEITTDVQERNNVNLLRMVVSSISTALCTLIPSTVLDLYKGGDINQTVFYLIIGVGFGVFYAIPLIMVGLFTKERTPVPETKSVFHMNTFVKPLRLKAFRGLVYMYLAQSIAMDVLAAGIVYFAYYVAGVGTTILLGSFVAAQLLMFPFIQKLLKKVDKRKIYYFGLPLAIVSFIGVGLYQTEWPVVILYLLNALTAVGLTGAMMMSWIIFPDVVDAGDLLNKERPTGSYSGIMTFIRKTASAIAIFLFGILLSLFGFVNPTSDMTGLPDQPDLAILGIRVAMVGTAVLLMFLGFLVARTFVLTNRRSKQIQTFLQQRTDGLLDETDPELKQLISEIS